MTTAAEIRARVARADQERIERRAKAAAAVAEVATRYERARTELAKTEQQLADAVVSALTVMTVRELGTFIRRRPREVDAWTTLGRERSGSTARPPKAGTGSTAGADQRPRSSRGTTPSPAADATADPVAGPDADAAPDSAARTPPPTPTRRTGDAATAAQATGRPDAADRPSASATPTTPTTPTTTPVPPATPT